MADTLARVMAVTANRFQMSKLFVRGPVTRFHIPLAFARLGQLNSAGADFLHRVAGHFLWRKLYE